MDLLERAKQKLAEQKAEKTKKPDTFLKKVTEKKSKKSIKSKEEMILKTDYFRTGISLITGTSKRDQPPVLKQKLMEFLENHEVIDLNEFNKSKSKWVWRKIKKGVDEKNGKL